MVAKSGRASKVTRIVTGDGDLKEAVAGQAVTLVLADEIDISRGDMLVAPEARPEVADQFAAHILWMAEEDMLPHRQYLIKVGTQTSTSGASATSLTVVVTQCQAEIITWFLTYAALKYTLESYHDYSPGEQAPDPKCPNVGTAHGVTLKTIQDAYKELF